MPSILRFALLTFAAVVLALIALTVIEDDRFLWTYGAAAAVVASFIPVPDVPRQ
jgi:hypothetical protein